MLAVVAAQLTALVAAAVPVEPAGCRDRLVRFHGRGPVDPAGVVELAAVGAEVLAEAVVGTIRRVRLADDAPAPEVVLRDDSGSGEDAAAVAVVVASKAVAAAAAVADDGTTEAAPSSYFGCFADHPAVVGGTDDDLDAAAAADEPSFLRIGSAAAVALVPEADSALGQSLANGCFALPEVVPCSAVAAAVDADDVADTAVVADDDAPVGAAAAAAAADGDCHPSGSPP